MTRNSTAGGASSLRHRTHALPVDPYRLGEWLSEDVLGSRVEISQIALSDKPVQIRCGETSALLRP